MHQVFPAASSASYCTACAPDDNTCGLKYKDGPEHRTFHCKSTLAQRQACAPIFRNILEEAKEDSPDIFPLPSNDDELLRLYFTWDLMMLHHPKSFPPGTRLQRFVNAPLETRMSLARLFKQYLRDTGLTRFLVRSLRDAVNQQKHQEHLQKTSSVNAEQCGRHHICQYLTGGGGCSKSSDGCSSKGTALSMPAHR
jgi:hypothetical protein